MLKTQIVDPNNGHGIRVNGEGELNVVVHNHPPKNEKEISIPFRAYFTTTAGSNDMRVDGSTTNVEFAIRADNEYDTYVNSISVLIADSGAKLNLFGALPELTNGVKLEWVTQDIGVSVLHEALKNNLNFIRLAGGQPAFGNGTTAFLADLSGGGADAYLPFLDLEEIFGMQWGMRLRAGTNDKLVFTVRDDLSTGLDTFNIIGYGVKF